MIASVVLEDLDPLRINVEADLTGGDLQRSPQRYPVTSADALSDRELDRVRARGIDAQSAELRVLHSTIFVARLEICSLGGVVAGNGLFEVGVPVGLFQVLYR